MTTKYTVVEYDVQDSPDAIPEIHRLIVRDEDLPEVLEYIENHPHVPKRLFRVVVASMWENMWPSDITEDGDK